jgi:hypothetical protein
VSTAREDDPSVLEAAQDVAAGLGIADRDFVSRIGIGVCHVSRKAARRRVATAEIDAIRTGA